MTVVLDSNLAAALALDPERAPAIEARLRSWEEAGESLHAPSLFRFEVANALTRSIAAGAIDSTDAAVAWRRIVALEIRLHELVDSPAVISVAGRLGRKVPTTLPMLPWRKNWAPSCGPSTGHSPATRRASPCPCGYLRLETT